MDFEPLYFGCRNNEVGHYSQDRHGRSVYGNVGRWLSSKDAVLPPVNSSQGEASLTHTSYEKEPVTWLAFWDNSVDNRSNSNSIFALPGHLSFENAVSLAKQEFPTIWGRFNFAIRQSGLNI